MQCTDVRMAIRDLPPETPILAEKHLATLEHYAQCAHCRPLGIGTIQRTRMTCEEAVAICLRGKHLLFDASDCETMRDMIAHEHVYGTSVVDGRGRLVSAQHSVVIGNGCSHDVCSFARNLWFNAPLCAHYDGDEEKKHGAEWTIDAARKAGWDIAPLLASTHERLKVLMRNICDPKNMRATISLREWEEEARHLRELLADNGRLVLSS